MNQCYSQEFLKLQCKKLYLMKRKPKVLIGIVIVVFEMIHLIIQQQPLNGKLFSVFVLTVQAVENPTATEIQDVCSAVGLNVFLEVRGVSFFTIFPTQSH